MKMDQTTMNAAYKAVSEFTAMSGYYAKFETVNGLNFAMVCNNHIAQRAGQRMGLSEYGYRKEYILSKIAEFLNTSEDAMWDMMEYPEFCIMMNAQTEKNTAISAKIATNLLVRLL